LFSSDEAARRRARRGSAARESAQKTSQAARAAVRAAAAGAVADISLPLFSTLSPLGFRFRRFRYAAVFRRFHSRLLIF